MRLAPLGLALALLACSACRSPVEDRTATFVAAIRAITADGSPTDIERHNKQLDEAWRHFNANKAKALPVLRKELAAELLAARPNQMLLLDVGYYLRQQEYPPDKVLAREAFFALDPEAKIVRWNARQLFRFAHAVAMDRDARTLPFLDRAFLRGGQRIAVPEHALALDETLACVFLYGVYGQAEAHLAAQLTDVSVALRALEVLGWIGSPESVPAVTAAMMATRDYDTFVRGTAFMMKMGGPAGRATMLGLAIQDFDAKSQAYYGGVRRGVEAISYETLRSQFRAFPEPSGKDDGTNPNAFLASATPAGELIAELTRSRDRMFLRVSDEALSDVKLANAVLNALRYRPSPTGDVR